MSKNRKQQLSRSLAKLVSIWLVNQINDFLWVFMNQFFCPFRLRNPAKNIATNPNIACTRGKWSLWWFEPCISKELKTLTGGILKQKKRESEKKIFCTYSEGILGLCCTLMKLLSWWEWSLPDCQFPEWSVNIMWIIC